MRHERLIPIFTEEGMLRLKNARVAVIGLGGVGGIATEALARSGVGHLLLCDFDRIESSNINRQVIASDETLGRLKVDVMREQINTINPECEVIGIPEKYHEFLSEQRIEYVIDAIDDVASKITLIRDCLRLKIPFISSMGAGNKTNPKLITVVDIHKTSYDGLARTIRSAFRDVHFDVVASTEAPIHVESNERKPIIGSYMPVVAGFGLMCSDYIIKQILRRTL